MINFIGNSNHPSLNYEAIVFPLGYPAAIVISFIIFFLPVLNTWNVYLLIISLFSFVACVLYIFQPESPKYLVAQNRLDEARETLIKVYLTNSGKLVETFEVRNKRTFDFL